MFSAINEFFLIYGGLVLSLLGFITKKLNEFKKEQERSRLKDELRHKAVMAGTLELLRYRLRVACEEALYGGCITYDEREDLDHMFAAYRDLGGNSSLTDLYKSVCKLPTCESMYKKGRDKVD